MTRLIRAVHLHVPFYRTLWDSHCQANGIELAQLCFPADLPRLPTVRKADLLAAGSTALFDDRYRHSNLAREKTSGSSGQPFEMLMDSASRRRRRMRFLRALLAAGCRPGSPLMLLADRATTPVLVRAMGWRYCAIDLGEAAIAAEYLRMRPAALYGPLSTLVLLGEELKNHHPSYPRPRLVISTAEELRPHQRQMLHKFFDAPIADFYGMTEFGLIAWRMSDQAAYRCPAAELLLEFLPSADDASLERLVITQPRGPMPLVRYETGDLVHRDRSQTHAPITRFAGREIDCLRLRGDRRISPYRITLSLEPIAGVEQYQVVQEADFTVKVYVRTTPAREAEVFAAARNAMRAACGEELSVQIHPFSAMHKASTEKLRPVRSFARETA